MKKFAKSLLCLVMAFMLVFSFAACNNDKEEEETTTAAVKEESGPSLSGAEKAVTDLLSDEETLLEITGMEAMIDSVIGSDMTEEQAVMVEDFVADILDFIEIDVVDSELVDDTTANVTVEVSYPDFENLDTASYTNDMDYMLSKLEEIGYTEETLNTITDENEFIDIMFELSIAIMEDMAADADVVSVEETVEVVYENDEWVVVTE